MAKRVFGDIPGYPEGTYFESRIALSHAGVHRPTQGGISGTGREGADSIVVSGGYEDDRDLGPEIVYVGHGGRDPETGEQVDHQELTNLNLALIYSEQNDLPVRVVRGANPHSHFAPKVGYRYDGLYRVEAHWQQDGKSGYKIWCFRLKKIDPTTAPWKAVVPSHLQAKLARKTATAKKPQSSQQKSALSTKLPVGVVARQAQPNVPAMPEFRVGDRVKHPQFGTGVVSAVQVYAHDQAVTIEFDSEGKKKLMATSAKLEHISG